MQHTAGNICVFNPFNVFKQKRDNLSWRNTMRANRGDISPMLSKKSSLEKKVFLCAIFFSVSIYPISMFCIISFNASSFFVNFSMSRSVNSSFRKHGLRTTSINRPPTISFRNLSQRQLMCLSLTFIANELFESPQLSSLTLLLRKPMSAFLIISSGYSSPSTKVVTSIIKS